MLVAFAATIHSFKRKKKQKEILIHDMEEKQREKKDGTNNYHRYVYAIMHMRYMRVCNLQICPSSFARAHTHTHNVL